MSRLENNSYKSFEWNYKAKEMKVMREDCKNKSMKGKESLS